MTHETRARTTGVDTRTEDGWHPDPAAVSPEPLFGVPVGDLAERPDDPDDIRED